MPAIDEVSFNRQRNLGYFFAESVQRVPDKVCILDLLNGVERKVTYRTLDDRMNRVAGTLARLGSSQASASRCWSGIASSSSRPCSAPCGSGAIPVPVNTHLPADTLAFVLQDAQCVAAVVDPESHPHALEIVRRIPLKERLLLDRPERGFRLYEDELAVGGPVDPPQIGDDAQAIQLYTSGSTGRPKGVIITHSGMLWYVAHNQKYWPASDDDRGLIALPLFHKNALRGTVKPMLYAGGSFVIMPAFEPKAFLDALAKYRCTFTRGVAAVFSTFLQHADYLKTLDLSALRRVEVGSGIVPQGLLDAVERALPGVKASESYGSTEGGSPLRPPIDGRPVPRGSIGTPDPRYRTEADR